MALGEPESAEQNREANGREASWPLMGGRVRWTWNGMGGASQAPPLGHSSDGILGLGPRATSFTHRAYLTHRQPSEAETAAPSYIG